MAYENLITIPNDRLVGMIDSVENIASIGDSINPSESPERRATMKADILEGKEAADKLKEGFYLITLNFNSILTKFNIGEIHETNHSIIGITPNEYACFIDMMREFITNSYAVANTEYEAFKEIIESARTEDDGDDFESLRYEQMVKESDRKSIQDINDTKDKFRHFQELMADYMEQAYAMMEILNKPYDLAHYDLPDNE